MRPIFALVVAALALPQVAQATAPAPTGKESNRKANKKADKKAKIDRPVSESAWAAMVDRDVVVVNGDASIRGKLAGHDADTATVIGAGGDLIVVEKDSVSELRAAQAAPPPPPPPSTSTTTSAPKESAPSDTARGFKKRGTYLYGSPGAVLFPFSLDLIAYRWGFGVGDFKPRPGSHFASAVGFAFDHAVDHDRLQVATYDPLFGLTTNTEVNAWTHILRPMAEFRLGGSGEKVFAYGLFGAGLTVLHITAREVGGASESDTQVGICAPIGAGVQGLIGERWTIGFEPRVVLDLAIATVFDAKLLIGAKF